MTWRPSLGRAPVPTIAACLAALAVAALPARGGVAAKTLCVGGPGCFPTIQLAVDSAHDGDTVKIAPGTFAGGLTIAKSIAIVGAGASRTTIKGGGPVITLGVSITLRGVKVTGGLNVTGQGGGVYVSGADAVVTIVDCVITRNRVTPRVGSAPLLSADGGGIANLGQLTLIRTTVSDNVAGGGPTARARGGGIFNATNGGSASLTIRDSRITGNTAIVTSNHPNIVKGGGISAQDGLRFTITGSVVSGNRAILDTHSLPTSGSTAFGGGIEIGGMGQATIASTRITGNLASVTNPQGNATSWASALVVAGPKEQLAIRDVTISGNRTEATALSEDLPADSANCCGSDVVEIDSAGSVDHMTVEGNTNIMRVQRGTVTFLGTVVLASRDSRALVIADSVIARNTNRVTNANGAVRATAGGFWNGGLTVLRGTRVSDNTLIAVGKSGFARGGGIWNGQLGDHKGRLTLTGGTVVSGNVLRGSSGIALEGGGLYAGLPVKVTGARITGNRPDQCHGC